MAEGEINQLSLSKRGWHFYQNPNMIRKGAVIARKNPYHPVNNPTGIVNLGRAENFLSEEMCLKRLSQSDMEVVTPDMLHYFPYDGDPRFKEALCKFFMRYFEPAEALIPENVIITSGVGAALDMLATLLTDPGDCFLNLAPCYAGLQADFFSRAKTELIDVYISREMFNHSMSEADIALIISKFESKLLDTLDKDKVVRGIVLVNPHNPIGYVMPLEFIEAILHFANKYDLHVIMDEVYAMTVFDEDAKFQSVLKIKEIPNKQKTHFLWGFSKDFGLAGVRCGVIYTHNTGLKASANEFIYFGSVPPIMQHKLRILISDFDWLDMFFTNQLRLIKENYDYCVKELDTMKIPYVKPQSAYFFWIDLSEFLNEKTFDEEAILFKELMDYGVYFLPGQYQAAPDPGWFRITFVDRKHYMEQGMSGLRKTINFRRNNKNQ